MREEDTFVADGRDKRSPRVGEKKCIFFSTFYQKAKYGVWLFLTPYPDGKNSINTVLVHKKTKNVFVKLKTPVSILKSTLPVVRC